MCYCFLLLMSLHSMKNLDTCELSFCSYFNIDSHSARIKVKLDFLEIVDYFWSLDQANQHHLASLQKSFLLLWVLKYVVGETSNYSFRH